MRVVKYNNQKNIAYLNDKNKFHRTGGPAVEYLDTGTKWWCDNGQYHRLDGPAIIDRRGCRWYLYNCQVSKTTHNKMVLFYLLEPQRYCINNIK